MLESLLNFRVYYLDLLDECVKQNNIDQNILNSEDNGAFYRIQYEKDPPYEGR